MSRQQRRGPGGGPAPDAARREELRREVAESRRRQGLPPYITDEATLDRVATLLAVTLNRPAQRTSQRTAGDRAVGEDD